MLVIKNSGRGRIPTVWPVPHLFVYFFVVLTFCLLSSNGLSGAARGAKSIVNRMGRGIAGVGRAGVDSVARNES